MHTLCMIEGGARSVPFLLGETPDIVHTSGELVRTSRAILCAQLGEVCYAMMHHPKFRDRLSRCSFAFAKRKRAEAVQTRSL